MTAPDVVEPTVGRIDHDDLPRLREGAGLTGDTGERAVEACLVFADDDD
jgi:hypothetical protein